MKRWKAAVTAATVLISTAGLLTVVAPPASAAGRLVTVTVDCTVGAVLADPAALVIASPGDTIRIEGDATCNWGDWRQGDPVFNALPVDSTDFFHVPPPYEWTLRSDLDLGTYGSPDDYVFGALDDVTYGGQKFYLRLVPVPQEDNPIPPWVQGYGRATADAVCLEGWEASWDQWPNNGTGGFVCSRSIPSLG